MYLNARRATSVVLGVGIALGAGVVLVLLASRRASDAAPPPTHGPVGVAMITTVLAFPEPGVEVCELLAFAAQADPVLQYADGRSADDIDAVAAVQREVLLAAAEVVGPGPSAVALTRLASAFVDGAGVDGPGTWDDEQWAEALVTRAEPSVVAALADLESQC